MAPAGRFIDLTSTAGLADSITLTDYIIEMAVDLEKQAFEAKKYAAELKKAEGSKNPKALAEANHANFSLKTAPNAGTLVEVAFPPSRVVAQ